jgi:hypothetical protein
VLDVVDHVVGHSLGVTDQGGEAPTGGVVERQLEFGLQHHVGIDFGRGDLLVLGEHLILGRLQDAVQAAQDRERQDHVPVLVGLIRPPQQIGDLPDQVGIGLRHVLDSLPALEIETGGKLPRTDRSGRGLPVARHRHWQ